MFSRKSKKEKKGTKPEQRTRKNCRKKTLLDPADPECRKCKDYWNCYKVYDAFEFWDE